MENNVVDVFNNTDSNDYVDEVLNVLNLGLNIMNVSNAVVSVVIVDNDEIRKINNEYRNKDSVTDVISFAFEDSDNVVPGSIRILGEIYLSIDRAKTQAKEFNHSIKREVCYLSIHGLLHLLGFDHINDSDKVVMRKYEEKILGEYDASRE